ncbi:hypothetical protein [Brachybacterium sillae]|nr:hypothetical protein [Brachybacterium sillae]
MDDNLLTSSAVCSWRDRHVQQAGVVVRQAAWKRKGSKFGRGDV